MIPESPPALTSNHALFLEKKVPLALSGGVQSRPRIKHKRNRNHNASALVVSGQRSEIFTLPKAFYPPPPPTIMNSF